MTTQEAIVICAGLLTSAALVIAGFGEWIVAVAVVCLIAAG